MKQWSVNVMQMRSLLVVLILYQSVLQFKHIRLVFILLEDLLRMHEFLDIHCQGITNVIMIQHL